MELGAASEELREVMDPVHSLADRLLLSLRTCATHPAGPLGAVAALMAERMAGTLKAEQLATIQHDVVRRLREMEMPEERRRTAELYLAAVFHGVLP